MKQYHTGIYCYFISFSFSTRSASSCDSCFISIILKNFIVSGTSWGCSYFPRYKFHSGNQKKNRKICQNQRCCITPYIVIYSVLATNIEISLRYLKHAAGILYFHSKQPESSSCAGIPAGTAILSG